MFLKYFLLIFKCCILSLSIADEVNVNDINSNLIKNLFSYNNRTVDPCENFFEYACGQWTPSEDAFNKSEVRNPLGFVNFKANQKFKKILESSEKNISYLKFVQKTTNYYAACNNQENNINKYMKTLDSLKILENIDYSFSTGSGNEWFDLISSLRKYGFNSIFWQEKPLLNENGTVKWVMQLQKSEFQKELTPFKKRKLKRMLNEIPTIQIKKTLRKEIKIFEEQLEALSQVQNQTIYSNMTLKNNFNNTEIMKQVEMALDKYQSKSNFDITVKNIKYMENLIKLLESKHSSFVCFYILLRFLDYVEKQAPNKYTDMDCIKNTRIQFPFSMNWLYENQLDEHELTLQIEDVNKLFNNLKQTFSKTLDKNKNILDAIYIEYFKEKLHHMSLKIGNIPRQNSTFKLEQFYSKLNMSGNSFHTNHLQLLHYNTEKRLKEKNEDFLFSSDADKGKSSSTFYSPSYHTVVVPITFLQFPIYHLQFKELFKYSSIGRALAHEILHAFDGKSAGSNKWRKIAGLEKMINDNENFQNSLRCHNEVNEIHKQIENEYSLDEKIADVSGLQLVFETFFNRYTMEDQKELFYLNFAATLCGKYKLDGGVHGTPEERVNYSLSNLPEFALTYNCSIVSVMNPEKKCQLW